MAHLAPSRQAGDIDAEEGKNMESTVLMRIADCPACRPGDTSLDIPERRGSEQHY